MPPTPSRKRKKEPSPDGGKKKLTKEEKQAKLAEDAARAKAWAEERAAKRAAKKKAGAAAAMGGAAAAAASSPAPSTPGRKPRARGGRTPTTKTTPSRRTTPARRTPVRKKAAAVTSPTGEKTRETTIESDEDGDEDVDDEEDEESTPSPPARPTPKRRRVGGSPPKSAAAAAGLKSGEKPSPDGGKKKLTKAEKQRKLAEDAARAKAWAERRKSGGKGKSPPPVVVPPTQQQPQPPVQQQQPAVPPAVPPPVQQQQQAVVPPVVAQPPPPASAASSWGGVASSAAARFRRNTLQQPQQQQQQQQQQPVPGVERDADMILADVVGTLNHLVGTGPEGGVAYQQHQQYQQQVHDAAVAAAAADGYSHTASTAKSTFTRLLTLLKFGALGTLFVVLLGGVYTAIKPTLLDWGADETSNATLVGGGVVGGKSGRGTVRDGMVPPCFFVDSDGVPPEVDGDQEEEQEEGWWSAVPPATSKAGITSCSSDKGDVTEEEAADAGGGLTLPCPAPYGRCARGFLVDCMGIADADADADDADLLRDLFVPSDTFDSCVPSSRAQSISEAIGSTLVDLTVAQTCHLGCGRWAELRGVESYRHHCGGIGPDQVRKTERAFEGGGENWTEYLFSVRGVLDVIAAKRTGDDSTAGIAATPRVVEMLVPYWDEGTVQYVPSVAGDGKSADASASSGPLVGLTYDYVTHKLPVPTLCWVRMLLFDLIRTVLRFLFDAATTLICVAVDAALHYPLYTVVTVSVLYITNWIRRRRRTNALLRAEVSELRELAYDRLTECDVGEGYAVLHLRDDLGHELYPNSVLDRRRMFDEVWPCVVAEVRRDNRIGKVTRTVGGKPLEHWEWVAMAAKRGRISRAGGNGDVRGMLSPATDAMRSKKNS